MILMTVLLRGSLNLMLLVNDTGFLTLQLSVWVMSLGASVI